MEVDLLFHLLPLTSLKFRFVLAFKIKKKGNLKIKINSLKKHYL